MSARLIPPVSELTRPFWEAASQHTLVLQYCEANDKYVFPPRAHSPWGGGPLAWKEVSGRGSVYTYTIAHRPPHPVFAQQCPMAIAIVELAEGPRMMTNIINCDPGDLQVGMSVHVTFEAIDDSDITLPVFEPA